MPAEDVFEDEFFASLYDCLNPWSVSDEFYLEQAVASGGPVLDLGCGTGMLACGLAARNLDVTGVDPSEAMLRVARSRIDGEKVRWVRSDGRSLRLARRFNFICMTGHAFQQLLTDDDAVTLLRTAAHHLDAEGRFVFETRNPAAHAWLSWIPESSKRSVQSTRHGQVSLFYDAWADPTSHIVTIAEHYHLLDQGVQRVGHNRIRFVEQDHLSRLLGEAGLTATDWYGGWDRERFSSKSKEIIVVAQGASKTEMA
jgi:ubiquinone/menaquinone biosynthesis C-methylase UbiE